MFVDDRDFVSGLRRAVGIQCPAGVVGDSARGGHEVLAAAVEAQYFQVRQRLVGAFHHGPGDRSAGAHPQAEAGQVVALRVEGLEQHLQEGGRGDGLGAAEPGDLGRAPLRFPLRHHVGGGAVEQRHQNAGDQAGGVGDRRRPELNIVLGVSERFGESARPRAVRVEGVDAALRPRGRARGVDDEERVVRTRLGRQVGVVGNGVGAGRVQGGDSAAVRGGDGIRRLHPDGPPGSPDPDAPAARRDTCPGSRNP